MYYEELLLVLGLFFAVYVAIGIAVANAKESSPSLSQNHNEEMNEEMEEEWKFSIGDSVSNYIVSKQIGFANKGNIQYYELYDKDTLVCYSLTISFVYAAGGGGWTFAYAPRLNADGTAIVNVKN